MRALVLVNGSSLSLSLSPLSLDQHSYLGLDVVGRGLGRTSPDAAPVAPALNGLGVAPTVRPVPAVGVVDVNATPGTRVHAVHGREAVADAKVQHERPEKLGVMQRNVEQD